MCKLSLLKNKTKPKAKTEVEDKVYNHILLEIKGAIRNKYLEYLSFFNEETEVQKHFSS